MALKTREMPFQVCVQGKTTQGMSPEKSQGPMHGIHSCSGLRVFFRSILKCQALGSGMCCHPSIWEVEEEDHEFKALAT